MTNGRGLVGEGGGGEVKLGLDTGKEGGGWETAQARVARLRAAARKVKEQESLTVVEKLYVHGRIWADRLHRATALGLIGATCELSLFQDFWPLFPFPLSLSSGG